MRRWGEFSPQRFFAFPVHSVIVRYAPSVYSRHTLIRHLYQQVGHASTTGDDGLRTDLGQWQQHEGALVHARMRHFQTRSVNDLIAEQKQVEVEGARAVAFRAHATVPEFEREQLLQQVGGRKLSVEYGNGVDKVRLVGLAHWRRPIERGVQQQSRAGQAPQLLETLPHVPHRVFQVAPEPNMGDPGTEKLRHR
jgi:hypothetical protein